MSRQSSFVRMVFSSPRGVAFGLSLYAPLLFSGIRVRNIADDWSRGEMHLKLNAFNRNMHGVAFGGTLFSMTDALFGTLVMKRLGSEYEAWTRTGTFQYLNPGRNGAKAIIEVTDEVIELIREEIEEDGFCNIPYTTVVENLDGSIAGIGQQDLHCRKRRSHEASRSNAEQITGGSRPRRPLKELSPRVPRGITLESLSRALAWRAYGDDSAKLVSTLSAMRRIPEPDDQAEYVCKQILDEGVLNRDEILAMKMPEKYLPETK